MKESIGGVASLNIALAFIAIVFAFVAATLSYYKAFKVNNIINNAIERYEGFNDASINEINLKLNSIGYQRFDVDCDNSNSDYTLDQRSLQIKGICVYLNNNPDSKTYKYKITSYMTINLPIISEFIKIPVNTVTNEIYGCYGLNEYYGITKCD